mmetsp:Transcript_1873/g.4379  ORF Transcript_1873/g.4379 Transcript_1873/m.4379 type:complete len:421 (-) Transcript_1873:22-1284(-)
MAAAPSPALLDRAPPLIGMDRSSARTSLIRGRMIERAARASKSAKILLMSSPPLGLTRRAWRNHRAAEGSSPFRRKQRPRPERQPKCRGFRARTRRQSSIDSSTRLARNRAVARLFQPSANSGAASTTSVKACVALSSSPRPMSFKPWRIAASTASSPESSHTDQRAASTNSTTSSSADSDRTRCNASSASARPPGGVARRRISSTASSLCAASASGADATSSARRTRSLAMALTATEILSESTWVITSRSRAASSKLSVRTASSRDQRRLSGSGLGSARLAGRDLDVAESVSRRGPRRPRRSRRCMLPARLAARAAATRTWRVALPTAAREVSAPIRVTGPALMHFVKPIISGATLVAPGNNIVNLRPISRTPHQVIQGLSVSFGMMSIKNAETMMRVDVHRWRGPQRNCRNVLRCDAP